jgi:predicted MFS family arabinose efflux permease
MDVPLTHVTSLIAVNQATSILGTVFGPAADRFGNRLMMSAGLGLLSFGLLVGAFLPYYPVILVALLLAGLGKTLFDPAMQGYIARRVPFQRRGLVIGILEISWAGSTLIGIPLVGLLIARYGWRSPFFALGAAGLIGLILMRILLKRGDPTFRESKSWPGFWRTMKRLASERAPLGALIFGFLNSAGNDSLFVVYGAWLESSFGLSVVALGVSTIVIGAAELGGESITAIVGDSLGLIRAVKIGLIGATLAYLVLPFLGHSLPTALTGLFFIFLFTEFFIVSFLSMAAELLPQARATMIAGYLAAAGTGRVFGALIGGPVWVAGGLTATCTTSAVLTLAALGALSWGLHGWRREEEGRG